MIKSLPGLLLIFFSLAFPVRADDLNSIDFKHKVKPILEMLCFECHGPNEAKGEIRFDLLDPNLIDGDDAETWHDVLDQLNLGEMPPQEAKQPTTAQRQVLTHWLQRAVRAATEAKRFQRGRVVTRRLTRYEYANTMRDLLGLQMDFARDLPPDPASPQGFLNNGSTLEMSPTQIEMYLEAARKALNEAIVVGEQPQQYQFVQTETVLGRLPKQKVAGHQPVRPEFILDLKEFPRQGEFELKITAQAAVVNADEGLPRMRVSMGHVPGIIHVPRKEIGEVDVSAHSNTYTFRGRMEDLPQPGPIAFGNSGFKGMIVMVDFLDADGAELRYPDRQYAEKPPNPPKAKPGAKQKVEPIAKPDSAPFGTRLDIEVTSVEFKSPVFASWPPPSHQRLVFNSPHAEDEPKYVRQLLKRFMTRAFRRPARPAEVEQTAKLFEAMRPHTASFIETIRETYASVLVSPHFLYRVEERQESKTLERVNDFELATRLSYFLWSSQPDRQLLQKAEEGELRRPKILRGEVERMLSDDRSNEFIEHFVDQWLDLDGLNRVAVNPEFFPDFENGLKSQMRTETQTYFAEILRSDRSAIELIASDWAMLNRALAKHYGLEGPRSTQFEQVNLKASDRVGGLLGQGAFLLANSNGEDSHPIKRAVWILDRLLDSPPASPPPDVPELDPESPDLASLSLKDQLAVHRKKESCANCHRGIDPWGVPLENFNAVGLWRTEVPAHRKRKATTVDATSLLPNGTAINGIVELQEYLIKERRDWFARAVVKRMMAYGLGRSLDFGDRAEVELLTSQFIEDELKLKKLIVALVQSQSFNTK